jgi:hypothetical protein
VPRRKLASHTPRKTSFGDHADAVRALQHGPAGAGVFSPCLLAPIIGRAARSTRTKGAHVAVLHRNRAWVNKYIYSIKPFYLMPKQKKFCIAPLL